MDYPATRAERLLLVERLRTLPPQDWDRPSLCRGWTVRHVLAHLVTPFLVGRGSMAWTVLRARSVSTAMDVKARELALRPTTELLDILESNASSSFRPPGMPTTAPLTDAIAHSADIRWAIGDDLTDWGDPQRLRPMLEFLVGPRGRAGFIAAGRLRGVKFVATDLEWGHGTGAEARGPGLAIAMSILGRSVAYPLLDGRGATALSR